MERDKPYMILFVNVQTQMSPCMLNPLTYALYIFVCIVYKGDSTHVLNHHILVGDHRIV